MLSQIRISNLIASIGGAAAARAASVVVVAGAVAGVVEAVARVAKASTAAS